MTTAKERRRIRNEIVLRLIEANRANSQLAADILDPNGNRRDLADVIEDGIDAMDDATAKIRQAQSLARTLAGMLRDEGE